MPEQDADAERRRAELLDVMERFAEMYHHTAEEHTRVFALDRWNAALREFTALSKPKAKAARRSAST